MIRATLRASVLALAALCTTLAYADVKISDLPAATALAGTEPVPAVQSGSTVKATVTQIDTYVKANGATLAVAVGGTGATTLTGVLHGNGTSAVTAGAASLTADVSGTLPIANGGTNLTAAADDNVMVGNATTWQSKALTSCSGASDAVTYNTSTNAFGCNTITASTGDTYIAKPSSTSRASTTTLAADPALLFTSVAAGSYSFDATFYVTNAGGTASFKYGFLASGAPTNSIVMCSAPGISSQGQNNWLTSPIAGNFAIPAASIGVQCWGSIVLASPTTLTFQWAQQTSDPANTTLNAGSYMHIHKTL